MLWNAYKIRAKFTVRKQSRDVDKTAKRAPYARRSRHALRAPPARILAGGVSERRADRGTSDEAHPHPRRRPRLLSLSGRQHLLHRGILPASRRIARVRIHRGGGHSLFLPWLEIWIRRAVHRAALRKAQDDSAVRRSQDVSSSSPGRTRVRLHGFGGGTGPGPTAMGRPRPERMETAEFR